MKLRKKITRAITHIVKKAVRERNVFLYKLHGRKPWTPGYFEYKWEHIANAIHNNGIMSSFKDGGSLPERFGTGIDERIVEYPWLLAAMPEESARVLDAGSAMNFETILTHPRLANKKITIVNLNPEPNCFWRRGISYVFTDMRELPFLPETFDIISCISTLEHVGMDNTAIYTKDAKYKEHAKDDYLVAIAEMRRVLSPGGKLFLSIPFGSFGNFGFFQQFDRDMLQKLTSALGSDNCSVTFYKYADGAWQISTETECSSAEYAIAAKAKMDTSLPAAAGAVACLTFTK
ncbi:MAG: class I SAM-dependent methyltransferase [bacterium]|nr:class I SAM-dependent methyltransferase [bacterium]